jgi:hypothetical protein
MKRNKIREELSKKRQETYRQITLWNQRVKEFKYKMYADPSPEDKEQLTFCEQELVKCRRIMKNLNKPEELQQAWVKGKIG